MAGNTLVQGLTLTDHRGRANGTRESVPTVKALRRAQDSWLERWISSTADLARLQYSHRMVDAVIDEVDGRNIRIGRRRCGC